MSVSRETQLELYLGLLRRWGSRINLTSERDKSDLWRHIADSQTLIPHLPRDLDRLIDLGSGQGFPAIPLAIETGVALDLIEADRRKAAFLQTVLATLRLRGAVWPTRIELTVLPQAQCVTARALGPLRQLYEAARPLLAANGCCLFLKGLNAERELEDLRSSSDCRAEIIAGPTPPSCLVKITNVR